ncbi:recombinase family protein [Planococcus halocryophilus]|uniref:recombinase family protein n=1 Tax=Planococcus halocryophilus TaxID=1215089 RepID=UPI001F0DC433|nr:recombinase family protein [Planococcus halocryophilus]MCH4827674.1 recombinase family protein [Planococcus halocryophilus]
MTRKIGVGYVRVSSTVQSEEGLSLTHQRSKIIKYCNDNNIKLLEMLEDAGRSGYNISDDESKRRPGLILLLDAIKNKNIDYVVITKNDRLGRDQQEKGFIKRLCRKHRVEIIYIDQPGLAGAASTPTEAMIDNLLDILDEFYSMNLGMEVKKIHGDLAKKGLYTGGRVPLGYKLHESVNLAGKKEKILVVDEETAPVIRLIYQMYLSGKGVNRIAIHLNKIKALNKGDWSQFSIAVILKNPNYYTRVWNRSESRRVHGYVKPEEEWIYAEGEHDTIISEEDWKAVQDLMAKKNKSLGRKGKKNENKNTRHDSRYYGKYILTGMIKCTTCGKAYTSTRTTSKRSGTVGYYFRCPSAKNLPKDQKCSNSLNMQKLDMVIWEQLCKFLTPEQIATEIDKALKEEGEKNKVQNEKHRDFRKRIKDNQKTIDNLMKVVSKIDISVEANMRAFDRYNQRLNELEDEVEELTMKLNNLGEPLPEEVKFPIDLEIVKKEYLINPDYINYLDVEVTKAIVNTLVDRIEATRMDSKHTALEIFFKFNHPSIRELIDFRKRNLKQTNLPIVSDVNTTSEEDYAAFTHFLSDLYVPLAIGEPSP